MQEQEFIIMEKIRHQQVSAVNAAADVFAAAVGQAQTRYVFGILFANDQGETQRITVQKRELNEN